MSDGLSEGSKRMNVELTEGLRFSFRSRPISIPGDMRISWRLSVLLLMLLYSRAQKASLAKLHILNAATRTENAKEALTDIIEGTLTRHDWQLRVEPAFGRAINFALGEEFVAWENSALRSALRLTLRGKDTAKQISKLDGILEVEKSFLLLTAPRLTEGLVSTILRDRGTR